MTRSSSFPGTAGLVPAALALLMLFASVGELHAQYEFYPYHGKNRVKYDKFDWHIYTTDHFEIYYYPDLEQHLERVAAYAESAYQKISADLRHELAFAVPLVVFKTHSEFQQQNIFPGGSPEGVGAFAEPYRDRIVLPIDEPPDGLYRLITHELTHIFMFDIIPRGLIQNQVPLWVDEGMADYMADVWRPLDMMMVRDVSVSDNVPSMTNFEGYGNFASVRVVYNLGHAAFEFIEDRWGLEGVRQFLFGLRRTSIGGGGDVYEEALNLDGEEFDDAFRRYLDDRFEAFRDKERPMDYGRDLAPDVERSRYPAVYSIEGSPTGELIAAMAVNRKDGELDVVLLSAADGEVVDNLTDGFAQSMGFDSISPPLARLNQVPWISWAPAGDRVAYFVRKGKYRTLIIQNVVTKEIEERFDLNTIDEPESPDFSPDGRTIAFSALGGAIGDIYELDLETHEIKNLTNDELADYAPVFTPDGNGIVYLARVSGNNKLFRIDRATGVKQQLTFGTHDDAGGQFLDDTTVVFASTAVDPAQPIDPDVARDGEIFNIWTLNLEDGELRQLTDTSTGNVNPIVIRPEDEETGDIEERIAFITYWEGQFGLHSVEQEDPLYTARAEDFGGPGPVIDFQAPLTHQLIRTNARRKGAFENMNLEGRPPLNFGVTNNGDLLGGTQLTFTDLLGDQQFSVMAMSVSSFRTYGANYVNLSGRLQYAIQGMSQESFFFGFLPGNTFGGNFGFLSRDDAIAVRTMRGGSFMSLYPFDQYRRLELSAGLFSTKEEYQNQALQQESQDFQQRQFGTQLFRDGTFMPLGVAFVQETTVFRQYGPLSGSTMRAGFEYAPPAGGNFLSRQTIDVDARKYVRLGENGVLALRARGFKSWGDFPDFYFFGGNGDMRGYDYYQFLGHNVLLTGAELRFPLIEAMLTPLGVLGGIRGTFFFNFATTGLNGNPFTPWTSDPEVVRPVEGFVFNEDLEAPQEVFGSPRVIEGFRLVDGRASYGFGLTTFAIGFPVHFDWAWRTLFNKDWEDVVFASFAGLGSRCGSDLTSDSDLGHCSRVVALLADYLEHKLPNGQQAELDAHLMVCESCVHQLRTYRTTVSLLRDLSDDDLPDELRTSALAFLNANRDHRTN